MPPPQQLSMTNFNTTIERVPPLDPYRVHMEALEIAGKMIEKQMTLDSSFPQLTDRMRITAQSGPRVSGLSELDFPNVNSLSGLSSVTQLCGPTVSGLSELDYPNVNSLSGLSSVAQLCGPTVSGLSELDYPNVNSLSGLSSVTQLSTLNKVPLPPEIMEHFGHMQCRCMMGVFPEICRAWLTIDSDIYIWDFEHGTDVAYYDGLSETIVSVGLVKPKPGVFHNFIRHLLVLTTTADIIVLGVSLMSVQGTGGLQTEINLTPEIIYTLPTDGVPMTVISGSALGRIFLGGKDGSLYEICYQKEIGWTGKRCKKVNHSTTTLSFLVPSFLNAAFCEDDAIAQISIDNSRYILYTLSEKGTVSVFDLGDNGMSTGRLVSLSQSAIMQAALSIARTLDGSNFSQLVSISAVTVQESLHVGLVAVTSAGSRLYFSTGPASQRPTTLHLLHVRLPPGFAANAPTNRPSTVHIALYSQGNLILVTSPGGNQDKVWCLSGDIFPLQRTLSETQSVARLDGVAWALQEMSSPSTSPDSVQSLPPLIVRQHYEPAKKFVVLTPNGAEIMKCLRPVDVLSQLLQQSHGAESDAVKSYFHSQTEDQACATCLLLACDQSVHNTKLGEWATRAFFLYGGEPKVATTQLMSPSNFQYSLPPGFNPGSVSTPVGLGGRSAYSTPDNGTIQFSAKHNGLYLFISRVLRPLWNTRIVQKVHINGKQYLVSSVTGKEVTVVASKLLALRSFLEKNTQFTYTSATQNFVSSTMDTTPVAAGRSRLQEVQLQEKHSLDALNSLVDHSCQVLGLWKIMCEHQFHVITDTMPQEQQSEMGMATFRDLILVGHEICTTLINKLINTYLNDNTSIDPISIKLRNTCPKLYRSEDAACTKANEMINIAKTKQNREEQEKLLASALKLLKEVAPQINLSGVCRLLITCHCYSGIVELVLECAAKCDPKDVALHYYMTNQPGDDTLGYQAYAQRLDCYKEVTAVLDHLRHKSSSTSYSIPTRPGSPPFQPSHRDDVTKVEVEDLVEMCMESNDQLLHMEVYEWLVAHRLYGDLIAVAKPSLELYLKKATSNPARRDAGEFADLLWKYHERQGNHSAAAQILYSLAKTPGENLNLEQRITYLAKAVLCMRSDQVGCAPHLGVFLHQLEDYLQVANVQKKVLDGLANIVNLHRQAEEAVKRLNSCLLTITELYEEFAEPYKLWECQLAIIDVSGHDDVDLIQGIWDNIIQDEMCRGVNLATEDKVGVVLAKVKELGTQYLISSRCFPVAYLMWQLEQLCCREDANRCNVFNTFYNIGISFPQLVDIYRKMYIMNDRCWVSNGNELYLIEVIANLTEMFINNPKLVKPSEKNIVAVELQDLITDCLSALYTRMDTEALVIQLKNAQAQLTKI